MVRQSLAAGSGFVDMLITPGNGAAFMHRGATGALAWSNSSSTVAAPQYVKLVRSGSTFTGYYSPNGVTWTQEGSFTYAMTDPVVVGLAASAVNNAAIGTALFDHVVISTSDTTPPVTTATVSGKSGNNGWYVSPVQVTLSTTDAGSGVFGTYYTLDVGATQTYTSPFMITPDGTHTVTYWSVDDSDNVETAHTLTVNIDATPPTPTFGYPTPAANANGWNNTSVSVPYTATDATSGVAIATPGSLVTFSSEAATQTQRVTVTDFAGATYVRFNGASTTFTVNSATQITATVPTKGSTGTISVTTPAGTGTSAGTFTYVTPPTITSFTPTSGIAGSTVTITGTNLTGATYVRFNGASTSFTVVSGTKITATVPSLGSTGTISVTTPSGTATSTATFTYLYLPVITSFTPTSGVAGTMVTITGTNFTGATLVRFNGASATFTLNSSTQITAKAPSKGSTGTISVTTSAGTGTSTGTYTY